MGIRKTVCFFFKFKECFYEAVCWKNSIQLQSSTSSLVPDMLWMDCLWGWPHQQLFHAFQGSLPLGTCISAAIPTCKLLSCIPAHRDIPLPAASMRKSPCLQSKQSWWHGLRYGPDHFPAGITCSPLSFINWKLMGSKLRQSRKGIPGRLSCLYSRV